MDQIAAPWKSSSFLTSLLIPIDFFFFPVTLPNCDFGFCKKKLSVGSGRNIKSLFTPKSDDNQLMSLSTNYTPTRLFTCSDWCSQISASWICCYYRSCLLSLTTTSLSAGPRDGLLNGHRPRGPGGRGGRASVWRDWKEKKQITTKLLKPTAKILKQTAKRHKTTTPATSLFQ